MLAAAGSAVGVGNLWRFPYLAAKDGGGLFLIVYLALVLTFGFTLLSSDIAIGRKTQKSAIGAYEEMQPRWKFLGILTFLVPVLIMTYYAVIGGWITKYAVVYFTGQANAAAQDNYFTSFITSPVSQITDKTAEALQKVVEGIEDLANESKKAMEESNAQADAMAQIELYFPH